ncbi:hypothetical protein GGD49_006244 [Rhizobium tropici]|nr:hypothetical protein [Rhizobium tropici]
MNYLLVVQVFVRIPYQATPGQLSVEINTTTVTTRATLLWTAKFT